jgi:hypothetical protein
MKLTTKFTGVNTPFEGNRTFLLQAIPAGSKILSAKATVIPKRNPDTDPDSFEENIDFDNGSEDWGATKTTNSSLAGSWAEIDFHGRRTLYSITSNTTVTDVVTLQVTWVAHLLGLLLTVHFWYPTEFNDYN